MGYGGMGYGGMDVQDKELRGMAYAAMGYGGMGICRCGMVHDTGEGGGLGFDQPPLE